jgi:hypothetical protein
LAAEVTPRAGDLLRSLQAPDRDELMQLSARYGVWPGRGPTAVVTLGSDPLTPGGPLGLATQ